MQQTLIADSSDVQLKETVQGRRGICKGCCQAVTDRTVISKIKVGELGEHGTGEKSLEPPLPEATVLEVQLGKVLQGGGLCKRNQPSSPM